MLWSYSVFYEGLQKPMSQSKTNTLMALLSCLLLAGFWLALIVLVAGAVLIGAGIAGSLNGGAFELPMLTTWAEDVPTVNLVAALIETIIVATGLGYICHQLRRILSTLAAGDPFVPQNARRLMQIALSLALIELTSIGVSLVLGAVFEAELSLRVLIDPEIIGAVIVLWILAQVFREGARLRESDQMTI